MSAACSPTATRTEFGVPDTGAGSTLASATLKPVTPRTLKQIYWHSTYFINKITNLKRLSTALLLVSPIAHVPPG